MFVVFVVLYVVWLLLVLVVVQDLYGSFYILGMYGSQDKGSQGKGKGKSFSGDVSGLSLYGNSGSKLVELKVLYGLGDVLVVVDESFDCCGFKYGGGKVSMGKLVGVGIKKGDLLGDLNVILCDVNGIFIFDQYGYV